MKELQKFPLDQYADVKSLCVEVVKRFSRTDLYNSNALRYDSGGVTTTPEAQFKEEFCAAAKKLLGDRIVWSSEWSNDGEGRIDFRIINTKWDCETEISWRNTAGFSNRVACATVPLTVET